MRRIFTTFAFAAFAAFATPAASIEVGPTPKLLEELRALPYWDQRGPLKPLTPIERNTQALGTVGAGVLAEALRVCPRLRPIDPAKLYSVFGTVDADEIRRNNAKLHGEIFALEVQHDGLALACKNVRGDYHEWVK